MTDRWHLTPQSGEIKGNNPYQLNRMTIDSSFRATSGYNLNDIQGYSATGEVVLKGQQLSLALPKEKLILNKVSDLVPANNWDTFMPVGHLGAKHGRKTRHKSRVAKLNSLIQRHTKQDSNMNLI